MSLMTCGFDWGFGDQDPCARACKMVDDLHRVAREEQEEQEEQEQRILQLCADGAPGKFVEGVRLERLGLADRAITAYRQAVSADDSLPQAHGNLGLLLLRDGKNDEAAVELTRGLMGRDDPHYHAALAEIHRNGKMFSLALFHYQQALKAFPDDISLHAGLAETYDHLGKIDDAEKEYLRVLAQDAGDMESRLALILLYMKSNHHDDALRELRKAAAAAPDDKYLHKQMGEIYQMKGEQEKADREFLLSGIITKKCCA